MAARIGCIAWGSLLWDPRTLPLASPFVNEGPLLPIEFSRVALDGRVTLVIDPQTTPTTTWWAPLAVDSIEAAVHALARREGVAAERVADWIGLEGRTGAAGDARRSGRTTGTERSVIARWLSARPIDAVVWTALPVRRPDGRYERPTCAELIDHLEGLDGGPRERAEQYVRRAPAPLRTPNRVAFEAHFGWRSDAAGPAERVETGRN